MEILRGKNKGRVIGLVIAVVFMGLAVLMTRPLASMAERHTVKNNCDSMFQAWTLAWDLHAIGENPGNLFNANIYYPNDDTLAYSDHQASTALLAAPILALTGNPMQTANYMLILNFFLSALGAYLLANRLTRNRTASFVAGFAFAFAAPRLAHMGHLHLSTAGWIPLCLLFLHRYTENRKWTDAALVGVFIVVQTLATWYYGFMLAIAVVLFLIVRLVIERKAFSLRWTLTLVVVLIAAAGLIVPFTVPYLKNHSKDPRFEWEIDEVDLFSADVRDFAIASSGNWLWGSATESLRKTTEKRGGSTERTLFPGLLPLTLGIAGAVLLFKRGSGWERFYVRYYVALAAFAVLMCLGSRLYFFGHSLNIPMPYDFFYYTVPGFKVMRVPARFIILVILSLSVLSAFAVRALLVWVAKKKSPAASGLAALGVVALLLLDLMSVPLEMSRIPLKSEFPAVYKWLAEEKGDFAIVEFPLAHYDPATYEAGLQYEPSWLALEPHRTYYSTLHWKKMLNGYSGFIPDTYYEAVKAMDGFPSAESIPWLKVTGIKYVIVHGKEMNPVILEWVFRWSLKKDGGLKPWKVFDNGSPGDVDYVYKLV